MAQVIRTTENASNFWNGANQSFNDAAWFRQVLLNEEIRFTEGEIITAEDLVSLGHLWNIFISHSHAVQDQGYLAFGNRPARGTTVENDRTSVVNGHTTIYTWDTFALPGQVITASRVNYIISLYNAIRTHTHTIDDTAY